MGMARLLLLTNARELAAWTGLSTVPALWAIYASIVAAVVYAGVRAPSAPSVAAVE